MAFYVYMIRCGDGSYYVGHTDDLDARFAAHLVGAIPGYTATRLPVTLVWAEYFGTREEAIAAERPIKGWTRAKKEALIRGDWDRISSLARGRSREEPAQTVRPEPVEGRTAAAAETEPSTR